MNYSQDELNQILLSKTLDDFYFSVIERRNEFLTEEEFKEITSRNDIDYINDSKEIVDNMFDFFQNDENLKENASDFMRLFYSFARIRKFAVLTMIDDEVYDITNHVFVDLKRNKIVHYDNIVNYYNNSNARLRLVTPGETSELEEVAYLKHAAVYIDLDDFSNFNNYKQVHINQDESEDLTSNFFSQVKRKSHTLSRKHSNN